MANAPCERPVPVALTKENVQDFLNGIDAMVFDCDGVIWNPLREVPLAREGLDCLRAQGKRIFFATNNSVDSPMKKFKKLGFPAREDEVQHPALAISVHLENIGFKKTAYVLAVDHFKSFLRNRGIKVVPDRESKGSPFVEEDVAGVMNSIQEDDEIGAVILDIDFNMGMMDFTRAVNYLRRPDCLFFVGASDTHVKFHNGKILVGAGYFKTMIEDMLGRKAEVIGKPATMMVDVIKSKHNIDLKRSVFVGDSLPQDMGIGVACGMKTLLVLTGVTQLKDLDTCDPALIPDYYIESVGHFVNLLAEEKD